MNDFTKNKYHERGKRYHKAIHDILIKEWDPIGVENVPEAQDEYDSYIPQIYKRLITRASEQNLFDYLWWVETEHMELSGNRTITWTIVHKLFQLNETIND
ncbi:MAG: hypothetical protein ACHQYP_10035 [Nitrospiria bacterium]